MTDDLENRLILKKCDDKKSNNNNNHILLISVAARTDGKKEGANKRLRE